jgi:hypothetical protein
MALRTGTRPATDARPGRRALAGAALLACVTVAVLLPFLAADPPTGLTTSNAPWTDEGFNLANARNRVLFGRFGTDDVDRSLTNGAYSGLAAVVFAVTGPSIPAGRAISVAAVAAAVLLAGAGLARPLGTRGALLAAAALGGCQLLLQYGRLGFTEPLTVALLTGALVLVARAPERPSWKAGAGAGVLFAVAISVKAIALVAAGAALAVLLGMALARRDRASLRMGLAALAGGALAAGAWLALVALPNLDRLRTGLKIWPEVGYPGNPVALVRRLGAYLIDADGALGLAGPLLLAAAAGAVLLAARWRELPPGRRDLLLTGLLWGAGSWGAIAIGDYAPNRYMAPALPGLAVLAGAGLAWIAGRRAWVAAALAVVVALPGIAGFVTRAAGAGDQLGPARRTLTRALPDDAVVYGSYGPTMLFGTRARLIQPWAPAGANVDDPATRFGVTHVLLDETGPVLGPDGLAVVPATGPPLATVAWGPHTLTLYAAGEQASAVRR